MERYLYFYIFLLFQSYLLPINYMQALRSAANLAELRQKRSIALGILEAGKQMKPWATRQLDDMQMELQEMLDENPQSGPEISTMRAQILIDLFTTVDNPTIGLEKEILTEITTLLAHDKTRGLGNSLLTKFKNERYDLAWIETTKKLLHNKE